MFEKMTIFRSEKIKNNTFKKAVVLCKVNLL